MAAEDFHLTLEKGEYDFSTLRAAFDHSQFAFRHPTAADEKYVVSPHPDTARRLRAQLAETAGSGLAGSAVVDLAAQCISVWVSEASIPARKQVAALLVPFVESYDYRIFGDEFGQDWTEQYRGRLYEVLGRPD